MKAEYNHAGKLQMIVADNVIYSYEIRPFQVINSLGHVRAVLKEYIITGGKGDIYKLYKTPDGNWYDVEATNSGASQPMLYLLKLEIDLKERSDKGAQIA